MTGVATDCAEVTALTHRNTIVARANEIAARVLAPQAAANDKAGRFLSRGGCGARSGRIARD